MGQDISKAFTPPPLTFRDYVIDGCVDVAKYMIYSQSIIEEETLDMEEFLNTNHKRKCYDHDSVTSSNKKARSTKWFPILCRADDGSIREATFEDSTWYHLYIQVPPVGKDY
jgi:hypothetical protein